MNKLIMIAVVAVSSLFSLVSAQENGKITQHVLVNKALSGTVFDANMPTEHLVSFNGLGKQGDDFIAVKIEVLGDTSKTVKKGEQSYCLENSGGITMSSKTLKSIESATSHKITKVIITCRVGSKQDMSDARIYNGTW